MAEGVEVGTELSAGFAAELATELGAAAGAEAEAPLPSGALELVVISDSCFPSGMGPLGLAGQDPRGLRATL